MTWGKTWLGGAGPNEVLWILGFTGKEDGVSYHMSLNQFPMVPVFETLIGDINGGMLVHTVLSCVHVTIGVQNQIFSVLLEHKYPKERQFYDF